LRSSDFAAFVKMMEAMLEVWKRERRGMPKNLPRSCDFGLKDSQRSKLVGSMITLRMVIPRGRVSMNITTLATSLASSKLPDSFASFNFSSGHVLKSIHGEVFFQRDDLHR
jgi:hypothetical protein